eukprot:m.138610 g.138610  ORF g.138610 m.138610 type:complete len:219 (+) comp20275_c1_seq1:775-1431(+)
MVGRALVFFEICGENRCCTEKKKKTHTQGTRRRPLSHFNMSLVWTGIALLLAAEIVFFLLLCIPGVAFQRFVKKISFAIYGLRKFLTPLLLFLSVMFLESMREAWSASKHFNAEGGFAAPGHGQNAMYMTRMFRAQRNMYVGGFAMFMMFVLHRTLYFVCRLSEYEDDRRAKMGDAEKDKVTIDVLQAEVETLRRRVGAKAAQPSEATPTAPQDKKKI